MSFGRFNYLLSARLSRARLLNIRSLECRKSYSVDVKAPIEQATIASTVLSESASIEPTALTSTIEPILTGPVKEFLIDGSLANPSIFMATVIENVHLALGTSWPATIAIFTLGLRAALFPFTAIQTRGSVKTQNLKPEMDKLRTESMAARQSGQTDLAKKKMLELSALMKSNGIGIGRLLGLGIFPVPFFMATFFALQRMAGQPIPSMVDGGMLWFQNLCAADPYYILPIITTATLLSSLEASRFMNPNSGTPAMKMFMRSVSLISLPVTALMPSAVVLYFIVSNSVTTAVSLMWRSAAFRRVFNVDLPKTAAASASPEAGFVDSFMNAYKSVINQPSHTTTVSSSEKLHEKKLRKALRR